MGGRGRTKAPRTRLQGLTVSVHLKDALDLVVDLESQAYARMGGTTKASMSDLIEAAVEQYLRDYIKDHGPLPLTAAERAEYVKRLAEAHQKSLRDDLHSLTA